MADKRISDLTSASTLTLADLLVLVNDSQTKKTSVGDLLNLIISQEQFAELGIDGKIPVELLPDAVFGAVTYQASWNATTNIPALPTAASENKGWYYVVGTAGTTNVNGVAEWKVGDWLVSNGSTWQKIDNTDAVSSWNGRMGGVVPESGDYTTTLVPEGTNKYYTAVRVLAELLAGLTIVDDDITTSDSILSALGKLQGQINQRATLDGGGKIPVSQLPAAVLGSVSYQGTWNATGQTTSTSLNLTTTAASSTNKGWYFVVSVNGTTSVGGVAEWKAGDWIISNGTSWEKIDNTDAVFSWYGRFGAVVPQSGDYNTSQVTEHASNLYYTAARVRAETLGTVTPANNAITTGDSISTAFNRAQGQIDLRATLVSGKVPASQLPDSAVGGVNYQGTWNATGQTTSTSLNLTTTAASSTNKGWYFVVSVNGTTSVGGTAEWKVGDWVISNGTAWQKLDNSESVVTVFGRSGAVIATVGDYNTSQVSEVTNLYYTGARVRSELLTGLSPVSGTITASDSVLSAFNKTVGALPAKENSANKGVANGYASLDSNIKLPKAQLTRGQSAIDLDFTGWASGSTEALKYSFQIPASVFAAGDQLIIDAWIGATGTTGDNTIKVYLHTSTTFGSGTLIGTYAFSGAGSFKFEREVSFLTNTTMKCGVAGATTSLKGELAGTMDAAITIPSVSAGFYVLITLDKANIGGTFNLERVALKGLYI